MIRVTAMYPRTSESHFDLDYYQNKHLPLVRERFNSLGMLRVGFDEGLGGLGPGEPPTYMAIGYLEFGTMEDLQRCLAAHAPEIIGDIPNFTNVQPIIQVNRVGE